MRAPMSAGAQNTAGRRRWLLAGVAGAAALAGAGVAWRRFTPEDTGGVPQTFWSLQFDTPAGTPLSLTQFRGRPLLLNFWATWCPPCVEEMPLLDAFYRQQAANGWQVLGLAVDQPAAVNRWLQRTPVSFPIGLAGLTGTELAKSLGNLAGGLPFTVVFDKDGQVRQRRMGKVSKDDLQAWASPAGRSG